MIDSSTAAGAQRSWSACHRSKVGREAVREERPSLNGYGAIAMIAALTASIAKLPERLRKTLAWVAGKELSGHVRKTGTKVFFADPHSPWQRPSNENTHRPTAPVLPPQCDRTDSSRWSAEDLEVVAHAQPITGRASARMEDAHGGLRGAVTVTPPSRRCSDSLNLPQYLVVRYTQRLAEVGAVASVGSMGDSYAMPLPRRSATRVLEKHRRPRARRCGVHRLVQPRRLHGEIGLVPPAEFEDDHYRDAAARPCRRVSSEPPQTWHATHRPHRDQ